MTTSASDWALFLQTTIHNLDGNMEVCLETVGKLQLQERQPKKACVANLLAVYYNLLVKKSRGAFADPHRYQNTVGDVIKGFYGCLPFSATTNCLATFRFEELAERVLAAKDKQLFELQLRTRGLNPPIKLNTSLRPLFYPFINKVPQGSHIGNPNWQLSRQVTEMWYLKQKQNLQQEIKFCYSLLLMNQELEKLCCGGFWKEMWYNLYCVYFKNFFQGLQLQKGTQKVPENFITQIGCYIDSMSNIGASLEQKSIETTVYHLLVNIFRQIDNKSNLTNNPSSQFQLNNQIFDYLTSTDMESDYKQLHYLNLIFLQKISKFQNNQPLHTKTTNQLKTYTLSTHTNHNEIAYFLQFFMTQNDMINFFQQQKIQDFYMLNLPPQIKQKISQQYCKQGNIKWKIIDCMNDDSFVDIFGWKEWQQSQFAWKMIQVLNRNQDAFISKWYNIIKIHKLTQYLTQQTIHKNIQIFLEQWRQLHKSTQQPNFKSSIQILSFNNQTINPFFLKRFYLPQDSLQSVVSMINTIANIIEHAFQNSIPIKPIMKEVSIVNHFVLEKLLDQFSQDQKDRILLNWGRVMMKDEDFLDSLLAIPPLIYQEEEDDEDEEKEEEEEEEVNEPSSEVQNSAFQQIDDSND